MVRSETSAVSLIGKTMHMVFITPIVTCKYLYFGTSFGVPCDTTQIHTVVPLRLGDHRLVPIIDLKKERRLTSIV